jgi:hypothetical protein
MQQFERSTVVVSKRLKPAGVAPFFFFPFGFGVVFLILIAFRQVLTAFAVGSLFFALMSAINLIAYVRTRNPYLLIITGYLGMLCLITAVAPPAFGRPDSSRASVMGLMLALVAPLGAGTAYAWFSRRLQWRGREVLELAAQPIDRTGETGYTSRPRPVGRVDVTDPELRAFVDFCKRHMIALPTIESDRTIFVVVIEGEDIGPILGRRGGRPRYFDAENDTWAAIDRDGNVSAHMARRDHLRYREDLSFDQLCASLGTVFVEFLTLFQQGRATRIVDTLDAMPVGMFR